MEDKLKISLWHHRESDLRNLTPLKARDLMVECFCCNQKELTSHMAKEEELGEDTIVRMVTDGIMTVCEEVGVDYNHPTKDGLSKVMESLAYHAAVWGLPSEVVEEQTEEVSYILEQLGE